MKTLSLDIQKLDIIEYRLYYIRKYISHFTSRWVDDILTWQLPISSSASLRQVQLTYIWYSKEKTIPSHYTYSRYCSWYRGSESGRRAESSSQTTYHNIPTSFYWWRQTGSWLIRARCGPIYLPHSSIWRNTNTNKRPMCRSIWDTGLPPDLLICCNWRISLATKLFLKSKAWKTF